MDCCSSPFTKETEKTAVKAVFSFVNPINEAQHTRKINIKM